MCVKCSARLLQILLTRFQVKDSMPTILVYPVFLLMLLLEVCEILHVNAADSFMGQRSHASNTDALGVSASEGIG